MSDTGNCLSCGLRNSRQNKFCYKCGAPLPWGQFTSVPAPAPVVVPVPPPAVVPVPPPAPPAGAYAMPQQPQQPAPPAYPPPAYGPPPQGPYTVQVLPQGQPPAGYAAPMPVAYLQQPVSYPQQYAGGFPPGPQVYHPGQQLGPFICSGCGYNGPPGPASAGGNGATITIVTVAVVMMIAFSAMFFFLLVPFIALFGLGIIYVLRQGMPGGNRNATCPYCQRDTMLPTHSPQGQFYVKQFYGP